MKHNIRVLHITTGDYVLANVNQVKDGDKLGIVVLYPLKLMISDYKDDDATVSVQYRRWNPFTAYDEYKINPETVVSMTIPEPGIMKTYLTKLKEGGADMSFIPNFDELVK